MDNNHTLSNIKGWGVDADPKNEPTYPMKKYTGDDHKGLNWDRPPQQPVKMEILHSIERPSVSAVFGTSVPLQGLSGMIRRLAFRCSENSYGHWLPLLVADRINVVEGIVDDLKRGYIPNIFAERGCKSEWKYNPRGLMKKVFVGTMVTTAVITLLIRKK